MLVSGFLSGSKKTMRVQVPFAGVFCAFSSPDIEDICRVRFHIFALPEGIVLSRHYVHYTCTPSRFSDRRESTASSSPQS